MRLENIEIRAESTNYIHGNESKLPWSDRAIESRLKHPAPLSTHPSKSLLSGPPRILVVPRKPSDVDNPPYFSVTLARSQMVPDWVLAILLFVILSSQPFEPTTTV